MQLFVCYKYKIYHQNLLSAQTVGQHSQKLKWNINRLTKAHSYSWQTTTNRKINNEENCRRGKETEPHLVNGKLRRTILRWFGINKWVPEGADNVVNVWIGFLQVQIASTSCKCKSKRKNVQTQIRHFKWEKMAKDLWSYWRQYLNHDRFCTKHLRMMFAKLKLKKKTKIKRRKFSTVGCRRDWAVTNGA